MEAAGIMPKVEIDNPPIGWAELFEKYWLAGEAGVFPDLIWAHPSMMVRSLNNDAWLPVPKEAISYDWINESFIQQSPRSTVRQRQLLSDLLGDGHNGPAGE